MRTTKLIMPIGQYEFYPIEDVIRKDPLYIYWLLDNCDNNVYYMLLSVIAEIYPEIKYDVYNGFKSKFREEKERADRRHEQWVEDRRRERELNRSRRRQSKCSYSYNDDYWHDETWCIWANIPESEYC